MKIRCMQKKVVNLINCVHRRRSIDLFCLADVALALDHDATILQDVQIGPKKKIAHSLNFQPGLLEPRIK